MTVHKNDFEKIDNTDHRLYGPRKLLLCGFTVPAQSSIKSLLTMLDLHELPLVWAGDADKDVLVGELLQLPDGSGTAQSSTLPRAVIAAGIEQQELHRLMQGSRRSAMQPPLWAVLTPTSENWPLGRLLTALTAEAKAMARPKKR